jgi:hypothetical protein
VVYSLASLGGGVAVAGTSPGGKIFRTTDSGASWASVQQLGTETGVYSLASLGGGVAVAGTVPGGKIFRTTDSGASWAPVQQLGTETFVLSLASLGGGVAVAGTAPGGKIFRTTDSGASWAPVQQLGTETFVLSLASLGGGVAVAGTAPGGKIFRVSGVMAADYALIYGHDLFTRGATLEVRGSTDNFSASNDLLATRLATSDDPLLVMFSLAQYRYWRMGLTGAAAPQLAIAAIGAALEAPKFIDGQFSPVDREVEGQTNRSENGHPLGRIVRFESWAARIQLRNVAWSWARDTFLPAWKKHLRGSPFGFVWESDLYPGDVRLVQAGDDLRIPHRAGALADVEIDVKGIAP